MRQGMARVMAVGVLMAAMLALPAAAYGAAPEDGEAVMLRVAHTGKCVEVNGASLENGAQVQQWLCRGSDWQRWNVVEVPAGVMFVSAHSGKCLDAKGRGTANHTPLIQWTCNQESTNQIFQLLGNPDTGMRIVARHAGKCLDIEGHRPDDGARLVLFTCHGDGNQLFTLED